MKVLYCIALLLIGWSSAETEKLDEFKFIEHCRTRDLTYVKAEVAKFEIQAVLEAKSRGNHCLMNVLYFGTMLKYCPKAKVTDPILYESIEAYRRHYEEKPKIERREKEKCSQEQWELVKYLLDQGADANEKAANGGDSAITVATYSGNITLMEMLLDYGADIEIANKDGQTPIIRTKNTLALSLLVKRGANINAKDNYGYTALRWATQNGNIPAMKLLLDSGANTEIRCNLGRTPIFHTNDHEEALSLLMKKGANINAKDREGKTALRLATQIGDIPLMKLLLDSGADTEIGDNLGQTPIFHTEKHFEALSLLMEKGAIIDAKDKDGKTALDVAIEWGFKLMEHGAIYKIAKC